MEKGLEQIVQDGKLHRHVNALIVAHLRQNNLTQAANAVASATMTPLNVEEPPNRLLELVTKGLSVEKDGISASYDFGGMNSFAPSAAYGSILAPSRGAPVDFTQTINHHIKSLCIPRNPAKLHID